MPVAAPVLRKIAFFSTIVLGVTGCTTFSSDSVTLKYYQIGGTSLKQLDREIKKKGPVINGNQHAVAVSNIKMTPDIALESKTGSCVVSRARIKVKTVITLPRWSNRRGAKRELARAWDNLDRYTRLHEAVHVSIAQKYARQLESRLKSIRARNTCEETGKVAKSIIQKTMKKHEKEQLKFDDSEKLRFAKLSKINNPS